MSFRKCACIDTLYTEIPFIKRFEAAKADGFESVEFWDWRCHSLDEISNTSKSVGIAISGFNGDADYSMIDPSQKELYIKSIKESVKAAKYVGASSITIHSNALGEGGVVLNHYTELSDTVKICTMYDILKECKKIAEENDICMNLEALNITTDHIGNFLQTAQMASEICRMVDSSKIKILFDIYHMQLNTGSICDNLSAYIDQIGHIHVADAPGRHEPCTGELNYTNIFLHLDNIGYSGRIGFELFPKINTKTAVNAINAVMNLEMKGE